MMSRLRRIPKYASHYLYSKLSKTMNWVYGIPNPRVRALLTGPVHKMLQLHHLVAECREGHYYRVSGISAQTGQPMKVAFLGSWDLGQHNTLLFYQHLLFKEGTTKMEDCGPFPMLSLRRKAEALVGQVDLIAIDTNHFLAWRPRSGDWVKGPVGVRMAFDFHPGENWEDLSRRIGGKGGNQRRVRKGNFSYRITREDADFTDFYYNMHVPMVKNRYQDYGDILNEENLRKVFQRGGFLMQILDSEGTVVAAGLDYINSGVLYGLINGVRDGSPELIKQGALLAIYYYTIQWCAENGIRRLDAGLCPPFITNGLYQHKRSWKFEPELNYWKPTAMLLWAPHSSPGALEWMKAYPIVKEYAQWGGDGVKSVYEGAP